MKEYSQLSLSHIQKKALQAMYDGQIATCLPKLNTGHTSNSKGLRGTWRHNLLDKSKSIQFREESGMNRDAPMITRKAY